MYLYHSRSTIPSQKQPDNANANVSNAEWVHLLIVFVLVLTDVQWAHHRYAQFDQQS